MDSQLLNSKFTVIDFETAVGKCACQIGITIIENGEIKESFSRYIQPPGNKYNPYNIAVHGITSETTENSPLFPEVWEEIKCHFKDSIIVAHNLPFDWSVLCSSLEYYYITPESIELDAIDTLPLFDNKKLDVACYQYGIDLPNHHNALDDSLACAKLLLAYFNNQAPITNQLPPEENKPYKSVYHESLKGDVLIKDLSNANPDNPFYDKKVVITGVFSMDRKDIARKLKELGADVDTSITKRTNFVCVGKDAGPKKLESIRKYNESGCNIVTLSESDLIPIFEKWG